jgi:hypothetical protein
MPLDANVEPVRIVPNRPRVVFDCVIFLQASVSSRGPAAVALAAVESGHTELLTSDVIPLEIKDVQAFFHGPIQNGDNLQSRCGPPHELRF